LQDYRHRALAAKKLKAHVAVTRDALPDMSRTSDPKLLPFTTPLIKLMNSIPPGLESNLKQAIAGIDGVHEWLPSGKLRYFTNAFIIQDNKVRTSLVW